MSVDPQPQLAYDPAEWLGDAHPLVAQLGSADGLVALHCLAQALVAQPVTSLGALQKFLRVYLEDILFPHELPAIRRAYQHICRNELRELIAYDQTLAGRPVWRNFAAASRRVGRAQLEKLRPLRDERVVQRYLAAVENRQAHGWHTLVYGMTLVLYSLPLRQGLLGYAHQTTRGFIHAAARDLQLREADCREVFQRCCAKLVGTAGAICT